MPIDLGDLASMFRHQRGQERLGSLDPLELPKELRQRCTVIPPAQQCLKRMLVGIERSEAVDAKQGRKKQRLKAV